MLGKYALANNVRTTLNTAINTVATTLVVNVATGIYKNPPNPAGGLGILTLIDSLTQPTKTEIVTYTGFTNNGNGTLTLSGVSRGMEGTVAQSFGVGAIVFQGMTAGQLDTPLLQVNEDEGTVTVLAEADIDAALVLRRPDLFTSVMTPQWALNTDSNYNLTFQNLSNSTSPLKIERSTGNATVAGTVTSSGLAVGSGPPTAVIAGADLAISGANGYATVAKFSANTIGAFLGLAKARGTAASPSIITNGDTIGVLSAYSARNSTTWVQSASISFEADGTQTVSSAPARIVFRTCAVSSTNPTEAMRINADNSATFAGAALFGGGIQVTQPSILVGGARVGTPAPASDPVASPILTAVGQPVNANFVATGNNASAAAINLAKGRGTGGSVVSNGDQLGALNWHGYAGSAWVNTGAITSTVDATPSGGAITTSLRLKLSADGTSAPVDVVHVANDGSVGINTPANASIGTFIVNGQGFTSTNARLVVQGSGRRMALYNDSNGFACIDGLMGQASVRLCAFGSPKIQADANGALINPPTGVQFSSATLDVNGGRMRLRTSQPPANATAAGNAGEIAWDANYIYVCTATNTWKRSPLSTW